ncbi:MAG: radical SAM protein, partial [Nitrososphaera sp.]|nr:radical SAM protein [Nitrososphaera sp.]
TNVCHRNCHYCGMRVGNSMLTRYTMSSDDILLAAQQAASDNIRTIMIQGGDHLTLDLNSLSRTIEVIVSKLHRTVLLCLGDRPVDDYSQLFDAGASQAIVKFETSNKNVYREMRPHSTLKQRLGLIEKLHALGYQMSSGFILGLPGTDWQDTERDLRLLEKLSLFAGSVSPFIPNDQSLLAETRAARLDATLECIARLRINGPTLRIPSVSALSLLAKLENRDQSGQLLGLHAGANVITVNYTPQRHQRDYLIYTTARSITCLNTARAAAQAANLRIL